MGEMDEVVKEFLVESHENLDRLDRELVDLEKNPEDREILASIFRTIHTIKGTCGFLAFSKLESVAHAGENLLGKLRDGELVLNPEITSALLATVDAVRQMLASIELSNAEGDVDYSDLVETLSRLHKGESVPAPQAKIGEILVENGAVEKEDVDKAIQEQSKGDPRHVGEILIEQGTARPKDVKEALQQQTENRGPALSDSNIRVDVSLLDKLMNLVGELVLARNQILQYSVALEADNQKDSAALTATSQRLNLITTELQEGVMKTRMQPIGNIWSKFPRVVRDLAVGCGKKIKIEMEGKETELDKTIIEAIKDPLTHLVRNSVDHGVEHPDTRKALGKPEEGRLTLRAFHEGGQVNIEISDDGAGINVERVKQKAIEKNLITSEAAARMSDRELDNLIFLPGFSTAERVTNVSGRGVGMDVVKTNIEKIGGSVDLQSKPGKGTTVKIKIPLTLAIIPALMVSSGGDRYAIPQVSLLELVRLEGEEARKGIEMIHGSPVYRLRGNLLPLVHLDRELGVAGNGEESGEEDDVVNIVILQAEDRQFGLVVEGINDTEEIVVKPLGKMLKGISSFAGATIMGDGRVALILDILGIAQKAHVVSEVHDRALSDNGSQAREGAENLQTLLVFEVGKDGRMAIPLSMVARLEEFPYANIEKAGTQDVVQYRGEIMPLIHLSELLSVERKPEADESTQETLQVVVYSQDGRSIGLVVEKILDIVEEVVTIKRSAKADGVLGSAVIQKRVTDLLDVQGVIQSADPAFFERSDVLAASA